LNINETYRRKDLDLPEKIMVQFIRIGCCNRGQHRSIWFVTSLLDNEIYPAIENAELYIRRWRIETLFKEVKINLSADVLKNMCAQAIRKEVAAG
jgi:IS4 transposase